jgi:hypothetical protein
MQPPPNNAAIAFKEVRGQKNKNDIVKDFSIT